MRLFTAIDMPRELVANLERLLDRLKPTARIKWSPPTNFHITTKFIGEWPEERLAELQRTLADLPAHPAIAISIRHLGFFPNPHSPRVFWAGIEAPRELTKLAGETDQAVTALGVPPEQRAFSPHLTLARIKERVPLDRLQQAIAGLDSLDFGGFTTDRFYLYQSRPQPAGSVYTRLSEFPLSK